MAAMYRELAPEAALPTAKRLSVPVDGRNGSCPTPERSEWHEMEPCLPLWMAPSKSTSSLPSPYAHSLSNRLGVRDLDGTGEPHRSSENGHHVLADGHAQSRNSSVECLRFLKRRSEHDGDRSRRLGHGVRLAPNR